MAHSTEFRALQASCVAFKRGVDPNTIISILYSKFLLTQEEKDKARLRTLPPAEQLDEVFKCLERRVFVDPSVFHKLVDELLEEPALKGVGLKMQAHYEEQQSLNSSLASTNTTSLLTQTCVQHPLPPSTSTRQLSPPPSAQPEQHTCVFPFPMSSLEPTQLQGLPETRDISTVQPDADGIKRVVPPAKPYTPQVSNEAAMTGVPSVGEVQAKIHEFEHQFNALKASTREGLKLRGISVSAVVECLTNLPADDMPEHKVFLTEQMDNLLQAESLFKLFLRLNLYWNYLAYHLLEHIIKEVSVEEVKGKMEKYKDDLQQFMGDTPLEVFRKAQKERVMDLPAGFKKLVAKFAWPQTVTLAVVEEFRQRYAYRYNLRECAMMVITIRGGSFTVMWGIPQSIVELLRKEIAEDIFSMYNVTSLEIAGSYVYKKVMLTSSGSAIDVPQKRDAIQSTAVPSTNVTMTQKEHRAKTLPLKKHSPQKYAVQSHHDRKSGRRRHHHGSKEPEEDFHELALRRTGKLDREQQESILNSLHPSIRDLLNVHQITPLLNQQGLLTSSEREKLRNGHHTEDQRKDYIIEWIPRKGSDALGRFLICLENSADGTGHGELVDLLERGVRKARLQSQQKKVKQALKGGMSYLMYSKYMKLLIATSTILAFLMSIWYFPTIRHNVVWLAYSPSLPSNTPYFIGRDQEVDELIRWLDLEDNEVRAVSITGPPGIGKSSLAVQVGHAMIDRGAVVSYVNAHMVPVDDLPGNVLCSTGVTTNHYSHERFLTWMKHEMKYPLVIIIDNCDFLAHSKKDEFQVLLREVLEDANTTVKIIATSRQALDHLKQFKLQEIDFESSCGLLRAVINRYIDAATCKSIVELTGNIPLSLRIVGAILKSKTTSRDVENVVASLTRELMPSLSFEDIPLAKRVNASVSVSLKYLKHNFVNLGHHLSLFPSHFSLVDVCSILSGSLNEPCNNLQGDIDVLVHRSLLQQCGPKDYQFNDIIKSILVDPKGRQSVDGGKFLIEFQKHYAARLRTLSAQFERNDKHLLCTVEKEKPNIRYFLKHICDWCKSDMSLSIHLLATLNITLQEDVFRGWLEESEFVHLLTKSATCLEQIMQTMSNEIDIEQSNMMKRALQIYVNVILHTPVSGPEEAVPLFERARLWVDRIREVATSSNGQIFYFKLAFYKRALGREHDFKSLMYQRFVDAIIQRDYPVTNHYKYTPRPAIGLGKQFEV